MMTVLSLLGMIPRWLIVALAFAALSALSVFAWGERSSRVDALEELRVSQVRLGDFERAQATAATRRREREIEREEAAKGAVNAYLNDIEFLRSNLAAERLDAVGLRGAIAAYQARGRGPASPPASAECRGAEDRASTLGDLLAEGDELLGEGRRLALEGARAAERHAAEVRALKARVVQDRVE